MKIRNKENDETWRRSHDRQEIKRVIRKEIQEMEGEEI